MSGKARDRLSRLALIAGVLGAAVLAGAGATMPDGRPTPSRQPVPRWLSLKSDEVRAREGPGLDYRILWEYQVSGLPVQVIAETAEWRKICDPEGAVAWVHRSVVSSRRSVFNASNVEIPIHAGRSTTSPVRARLSPRSLVSMDACEDGWCEVRVRRMHGWVRQNAVFGAQQHALCNASRPAGTGRD
ncbi:SH3 domain-containing protein [Brevundimonas lenta]|uniref:SH3-like domain-containing protein n=1 Tax=Brevundimonas lenta TaxID=424796 RepID=A0A7W6J9Y7_9CAUL|nr:SH3-like domain-containing protein [Brevundimonas lenta]